MKEEAKGGDYILCRGMLVLVLCAAVLGAGFYLVGSPTPDYNIRGQAAKQVSSNRGSPLRCEGGGISVYEVSWSEWTPCSEPNEQHSGASGGVVFYKRRYFVDAETYLPRRIEKYSRDGTTGEYVLRETLIIEYPTDEEMREVILEMLVE